MGDVSHLVFYFSLGVAVVALVGLYDQRVEDPWSGTFLLATLIALAGATPVPCIRCNERVKFKDLMETARDLDADCMATGHYIQRMTGARGPELHRAADPARDQSYFLFSTTQEQLDFLRFPLGHLASKAETRALAAKYGLSVADKPDSQDICFVPDGDYVPVIERLRPENPRLRALIVMSQLEPRTTLSRLMPEAAAELDLPPNSTLVVNDNHGALCAGLQPLAQWTDSWLAAESTQRNLANNTLPPVPVRWSIEEPPEAACTVCACPRACPTSSTSWHGWRPPDPRVHCCWRPAWNMPNAAWNVNLIASRQPSSAT